MIQNVLQHIGGVGVYGVISIGLFFAFFLGMLGWVWRLKQSHLDSMSELPLDDGNTPGRTSDKNHDF
jgi:cytochrome c oxidase cbb3-type subunit 4